MEDFSDEEESYYEDSDEDPSYTIELIKAQSNLSKLSINKKTNSSNNSDLIFPAVFDDGPMVPAVFEDGPTIDYSHLITDIVEPPTTLNEGMKAPKLSKEDLKNFEHVQKIIDGGQVDKLKVEQCKVYLRKHELRLTGKKEVLIQRIKEHIEIQNGGGERKYPPSSFVLNCKGDACLGDVVMFEQTVYEGYSIVSRSACGPPCGKRTIAGRIVNESYGAAKQQHTFTVEVLWSKGEKPLPPLSPLLIKGRNLYKLETRRQKWADEAERQRVLNEKHSRGTTARSDREARVQEKMAKLSLKGTSRANPKNKENPRHQNVSKPFEKLASNVRQQGLPQPKVPSASFNQVSYDYTAHNSFPAHGYQRHVEYKGDSHVTVSKPPSYQQRRPIVHYNREPYAYGKEKLMTSSHGSYPITDTFQGPQRTTVNLKQSTGPSHGNYPITDTFQGPQRTTVNLKQSTGPSQRPAQKQQLCRHFPLGRCYFGDRCKFLHEPSRNYC